MQNGHYVDSLGEPLSAEKPLTSAIFSFGNEDGSEMCRRRREYGLISLAAIIKTSSPLLSAVREGGRDCHEEESSALDKLGGWRRRREHPTTTSQFACLLGHD